MGARIYKLHAHGLFAHVFVGDCGLHYGRCGARGCLRRLYSGGLFGTGRRPGRRYDGRQGSGGLCNGSHCGTEQSGRGDGGRIGDSLRTSGNPDGKHCKDLPFLPVPLLR